MDIDYICLTLLRASSLWFCGWCRCKRFSSSSLELDDSWVLPCLTLELTSPSSSLSVSLIDCLRLCRKAVSYLSLFLDLWGRWFHFTLALFTLGILAYETQLHRINNIVYHRKDDMRAGNLKNNGSYIQCPQVNHICKQYSNHFTLPTSPFPIYAQPIVTISKHIQTCLRKPFY